MTSSRQLASKESLASSAYSADKSSLPLYGEEGRKSFQRRQFLNSNMMMTSKGSFHDWDIIGLPQLFDSYSLTSLPINEQIRFYRRRNLRKSKISRIIQKFWGKKGRALLRAQYIDGMYSTNLHANPHIDPVAMEMKLAREQGTEEVEANGDWATKSDEEIWAEKEELQRNRIEEKLRQIKEADQLPLCVEANEDWSLEAIMLGCDLGPTNSENYVIRKAIHIPQTVKTAKTNGTMRAVTPGAKRKAKTPPTAEELEYESWIAKRLQLRKDLDDATDFSLKERNKPKLTPMEANVIRRYLEWKYPLEKLLMEKSSLLLSQDKLVPMTSQHSLRQHEMSLAGSSWSEEAGPMVERPLPVAMTTLELYLKDNNLRWIDFFRMSDKAKDWTVSANDINDTIKKIGINLSPTDLNDFVAFLDVEGMGKLKYRQLISRRPDYIQEERHKKKMQKQNITQLKEDTEAAKKSLIEETEKKAADLRRQYRALLGKQLRREAIFSAYEDDPLLYKEQWPKKPADEEIERQYKEAKAVQAAVVKEQKRVKKKKRIAFTPAVTDSREVLPLAALPTVFHRLRAPAPRTLSRAPNIQITGVDEMTHSPDEEDPVMQPSVSAHKIVRRSSNQSVDTALHRSYVTNERGGGSIKDISAQPMDEKLKSSHTISIHSMHSVTSPSPDFNHSLSPECRGQTYCTLREEDTRQSFQKYRQQRWMEYERLVELCRQQDVPLTEQVLKKVLLHPVDKPRKAMGLLRSNLAQKRFPYKKYRIISDSESEKSSISEESLSDGSDSQETGEAAQKRRERRRRRKEAEEDSSDSNRPEVYRPMPQPPKSEARNPAYLYPQSKPPPGGPQRVRLSTGWAPIAPKIDCWVTFPEYVQFCRNLDYLHKRTSTNKKTDQRVNQEAFWPGRMLDKLTLPFPTPASDSTQTHFSKCGQQSCASYPHRMSMFRQ